MPQPTSSAQLFRLDGKRALVTGAGSGIGRATALLFAKQGIHQLILAGRDLGKLQSSATLIERAAPSCQLVCIAADLATEAGRGLLGAAVGSAPLDVLVNNAGTHTTASLRQTSSALWRQIFAVNVDAPFALTRDLAGPLAAARGAVVNVSSTLSQKPIADASAYNASKAALDQLTRSLALELAPEHIRVNAILPAIVDTPLYRARFESDAAYAGAKAELDALHPLGRIGQPDDIAAAILFLASPAASWITGALLPVDGGMLCT